MALVGPTAAGKTAIALAVARRTGAAVLSVDSMQVFRGMDIGTAKPSATERAEIPHLMIDVADPVDEFSAAQFQHMARDAIDQSGSPVLVVGGSGLHFRAVVDPLEFPPTDQHLRSELEATPIDLLVHELVTADPRAGDVVDMANPRRVVRSVEILRLTGRTPSERRRDPAAEAVRAYRSLGPLTVVGIDPGDVLAQRVSLRVSAMREEGLLDEVADLLPRLGRQAAQAVGYKELAPVVGGELDEHEGFAAVTASTLALVRRQRTFFRRDPRIRWTAPEDAVDVLVAAVEGAHSWTS